MKLLNPLIIPFILILTIGNSQATKASKTNYSDLLNIEPKLIINRTRLIEAIPMMISNKAKQINTIPKMNKSNAEITTKEFDFINSYDPFKSSILKDTEIIKFTPRSSKTHSVIPSAEGLVYEGKTVSPTEVFKVEDKYYMLVNDLVGGWPSEKINIALLQSNDLINWSWIEKPIITSDQLKFNLTKPMGFATSIIKTEESYLLYFDVIDNDRNVGIGMASAKSLFGPWQIKDEMILKSQKDIWAKETLAGADVIYYKGKYLMYFMGVPSNVVNGETAVCLAESNDGFHWSYIKDPLLLKSNGDDFDKHRIGVPKVEVDNNRLIMIYRTDNGDGTFGGESAYGIATSEDGTNWNRIQNEPVLHENDVDNWRTIWACGFLIERDKYHLFLEYDGPPFYHTRINHSTYIRN